MTTYYAQIQYVPDPIAGERINVGIVALDEHGCTYKFVRDWRRAATFGGQEVGFLRAFADEAIETGGDWFSLRQIGNTEGVSTALRHWNNKIQFSELKPSTKGRDDLIAEMATIFLHGETPVAEATATSYIGRGREKVVSSVSKSLGAAMRARYGHAPRGLLQRDVLVKGHIESHELHVGLKNGALYGGAFTVSYETGSPKMQQRDTDAIAFALEDLARQPIKNKLAVVVLPPPDPTLTFNRARHIFRELDVPIVVERGLAKWAKSLVETLPDELTADHAAAATT
jgi:hypothetical protein